MPTLRDLADNPVLDLTVRCGSDAALDRGVGVAYGSDLLDPTPFLTRGEELLLLTTGAHIPRSRSPKARKLVRDYVQRLRDFGVVGLGFGICLYHPSIPQELCRQAEERNFPVLAVPYDTPFQAIIKTVSHATTSATDHLDTSDSLAGSLHILTREALKGVNALAERLRTLLNEASVNKASVVALGPEMNVLANCSPRTDAQIEEALRRAAINLEQNPGGPCLTCIDGDEFSTVKLRNRDQTFGYLAIGRAVPFTGPEFKARDHAVSLLTLRLAQDDVLKNAYNQLRTAVFRMLLAGQHDAARDVAQAAWRKDVLPSVRETFVLYLVAGDIRTRANVCKKLRTVALEGNPVFFVDRPDEGRLLVVIRKSHTFARSRLEDYARKPQEYMRDLGGKITLGISQPCRYHDFTEGYRQAVRAVESGLHLGVPVTLFCDLGARFLTDLVRKDSKAQEMRATARRLIEPLIQYDEDHQVDLVNCVRVWLEHNCRTSAAARALGLIEQTLDRRLHSASNSLRGVGLDLYSPAVRAELWFAFQICDGAPAPSDGFLHQLMAAPRAANNRQSRP
ncbi:PucR family transcriptional regulator [Saccharopolyspora sp. NPDC003752]